ncbi:TolC family protein [Niveibacterium sp. SC-1]|uniref:TolC family protein n=1 Tax=Niveibacterium sp. SC-1 TaxID=3135646 RepID=UPI00311D372F
MVPRTTIAVAALALSGCVSFSNDGGLGAVQDRAASLGKDIRWARSEAERGALDARVSELLGEPLGVEEAVQVALLSNRGLQADYSALGLAEADLVQASRLPNPQFSMLRAQRGDDFKIEQAITFNLISLIAVPLASQVEARRFQAVQLDTAAAVFRAATEARASWVEAVAAGETLRYMQQVEAAAAAGAELAERLARAGNISQLGVAREQAFHAETAAQLARSRHGALAARERLARALGLGAAPQRMRLPEQLPALPQAPREAPEIATALPQRLDLQALASQTEALAKNLGLTRATRLINVLEFGPARVLEGTKSDPYKYGWELSFELPLFDFGAAKVARAETAYMAAINRAAQQAGDAASELRERYAAYRTSFEVARQYRDEILPLRRKISEENLLRYNGMLIGVFELLADAREQAGAALQAIAAQRDFWLAESDLQMSLVGIPGSARQVVPATAVAVTPAEH